VVKGKAARGTKRAPEAAWSSDASVLAYEQSGGKGALVAVLVACGEIIFAGSVQTNDGVRNTKAVRAGGERQR
jgi:hypothetical protein